MKKLLILALAGTLALSLAACKKNETAVIASEEIPVIAFGISTNHSPQAVSERNAWVATEDYQINVPEHQLPIIEKMMNDRNAVKLCKEGHMGIKLVEYQNNWGKQYKMEFVDM